jgi:hypothetical protein
MLLIPALLGLVSQLAPTLLGLFAGPKAADVASQVISVAQAVTNTTTQEAAHTALQADPAKADQLRAQLAQIALDHLQADDADRANARAREITLKDRTPEILAFAVTVGFFGLLGVMAFVSMPQVNTQILNILLGSLGSGWMMVLGYYFGASSPSQQQGVALKAPLGK